MKIGIAVLLIGIFGALFTTFIYTDFPYAEYAQVASFLMGVIGITLIEKRKK